MAFKPHDGILITWLVSVLLLLASLIISQNIFPAVLAPITTKRSASATIRLDSISFVCSTLIISILHHPLIIIILVVIIIIVIIVVLLIVGLVYVVVIFLVVIVVDVVIILIVDVISLVDADIRPRGSSKDPVIAQPEEVLSQRELEEEDEEEAVEHCKVSCLHSWVAGTTQHITALHSSVQTSRTTASTDWLHCHWVAYKLLSSPQHRWGPGTEPEKVAAGRK